MGGCHAVLCKRCILVLECLFLVAALVGIAHLGVLHSVVQTNSATAEEYAATSEELSGQVQLLKNQVSKFRLKNISSSSLSWEEN